MSIRRRQKIKHEGYGDGHRRQLLTGHSYPFEDDFGREDHPLHPDTINLEAMAAAWEELRAELLPAFIREHPGHRPYAFYKFDCPALNRPDPDDEMEFLRRHGMLTEAGR